MIDYLEKQQLNPLQHQVVQMTTQAGGAQGSSTASQHQLLQLQQSHYPLNTNAQLSQTTTIQQPVLIDVQANQQLQQQPGNNELIGYYFGSISRETAEWILKNHGNYLDGAYLLRSSGPNDSFVLSLMVVHGVGQQAVQCQAAQAQVVPSADLEVLHYKIVETEDSFVALHGQVGDEKFATIDELIDKAQGVATKPRWPILRQSLESQILPPTYWGLTVDQVRLAILIKAKQWGFPLSSIFQQQQQQQQQQSALQTEQLNYDPGSSNSIIDSFGASNVKSANGNNNVTPLNNETIRTLIYKSLHEFQPWFHGKISREEAERRVDEGQPRDGRFLVRERDNYSYAMCISHKRTTKHYRIDVIPTGELAIQDGRKFTSLMALVSHYTIMSDGLWCALTEACPRPIQASDGARQLSGRQTNVLLSNVAPKGPNGFDLGNNNNLYCVPPPIGNNGLQTAPSSCSYPSNDFLSMLRDKANSGQQPSRGSENSNGKQLLGLVCPNQNGTVQLKAPIKEWLHNINTKWSQLMSAKSQHQSLNSFLFGSSNPLNNHCRHSRRSHHHHHHHHHNHHNDTHRRKSCKTNAQVPCVACQRHPTANSATLAADNRCRLNGAATTKPNRHQDNIIHQQTRNNCSCCQVSANIPTAKYKALPSGCEPQQQQQVVNSLAHHQTNQMEGANGGLFVSHLGQNSGFSLNGNSFIGSPLFAVKPTAITSRDSMALTGNGSGGSSGGESENGRARNNEEKLISPAQSVASNLNLNNNNNNNPYNIGSDIYRSPASTAIVNDQQMIATSSSSSSGAQQFATSRAQQQQMQLPCVPTMAGGACKPTNYSLNNKYQQQQQQQQTPAIHHAGPIMCGQHAGPAYRYTNCNAIDGLCTHHTSTMRPLGSIRAADDSLLLSSPSSQLAGPAAMAKFVQFQDGQCLRTHRDTKSIQMAYLSSIHSRQIPNTHHQRKYPLATENQVPNSNNPMSGYIPTGAATISGSRQHVQRHSNGQHGCNTLISFHRQPVPNNNNGLHQQQHQRQQQQQQQRQQQPDFDLIDCDGDGFDFKYDPKMIKSSSIETLCGVGETEQEKDCLEKYKNNQELVMSLQSYWLNGNNTQQPDDILHPIPVYGEQQQHQQVEENNFSSTCNEPNCKLNSEPDQQEQQTLLTSFGIINDEPAANDKQAEQYDDYLKKTHGLDELTTSLLAKLTEDLKAQVDLKNKRAGFGGSSLHENANNKQTNQQQQIATEYQASRRDQEQSQAMMSTTTTTTVRQQQETSHETNPRELINEFDTLVRSQNN